MSALRGQWLLLRRDRTAAIAYLLFALACVVALSQGVSSARREAAFRLELEREEVARTSALREALAGDAKSVEIWNDPRNAGAVGRSRGATLAFLPPGPFAALRVSPAQSVSVSTMGGALDRAMGNIENPRLQGIGSFDLAFVIVALLPLFLLALTFDVVARDRESGVLRLLVAQGTRAIPIYALRALFRGAPLVLLAMASAILAALLTGHAPSGVAVLVCAIAAYGLFWVRIALVVQGVFHARAGAGLAALATWVFFVVAAPTLLEAFVDARIPIPSRIERTILVREASRQASLEGSALLARYFEDHPELAHDGVRPDPNDFFARQVAVSASVRAARAPVEARYREALVAQHRLVGTLSAASPVVVLDRLFDDLAGTSRERSDVFFDQVSAFQRQFSAYFDERVLRRERLTVKTLAERPAFTFDDVNVSDRAWTLGALLAWCTLSVLLALRGLARATNFDRAPSRGARASRERIADGPHRLEEGA